MPSRPASTLVLPALLLPALAAACGHGEEPTARRSRLGDTLVVENEVPLVADTLVLREVGRIGRTDGPLEYLLQRHLRHRRGAGRVTSTCRTRGKGSGAMPPTGASWGGWPGTVGGPAR